MTTFCHQLKYLLWKNWILRKRNKIRMGMEFLWPLVIFLILMWVRTRGLKEHQPQCLMRERALPSVSGFEFMQNFFCTLNNTCYERSQDLYQGDWKHSWITNYTRSTAPILRDVIENPNGIATAAKLWNVTQMYAKFIKRIIKNDERENSEKLGKTTLSKLMTEHKRKVFYIDVQIIGLTKNETDDFLKTEIDLDKAIDKNMKMHEVIEEIQRSLDCNYTTEAGILIIHNQELFLKLCSMDPGSKGLLFFAFAKAVDVDILQLLLKAKFEEEMNMATDLLMFNAKTLKSIDVLSAIKIGKFLSVTANHLKKLLEDIKNNGGFSVGLLTSKICGDAMNQIPFAIDPDQEKDYKEFQHKYDTSKNKTYEIYEDASPFCNGIFLNLQRTPMSNYIWNKVKPIIRGQIYFTPDTQFTRKIMSMVGAKFSSLQQTVEHVNQMLKLMNFTKEWIIRNDKQLDEIKDVIDMLDETIKKDNSTVRDYLVTLIPANIWMNLPEYKDGIDFIKSLPPQMDKLKKLADEYVPIIDCIKYPTRNASEMFTEKDKLVPFESEHEAVEAALDNVKNNRIWAVISFLNIEKNGTAPNHLSYKIRMDSSKVDNTRYIRDRKTRKSPRRNPVEDLKYLTEGFIYLQEMTEQSIIELRTGKNFLNDGIQVYLQQFPYHCYIHDEFIRAVSKMFPLFMVISWIYATSMVVKNIVHEKETKIREVMKVMGLSNNVIWVGWFLDALAVMSISAFCLTLILKFGYIIEYSNFWLILFFMESFVVASICFSFLISTFFQRANSAAAAGGAIFLVTYLPYSLLLIWEDHLTFSQILASNFLSNVAFGFGANYFARAELDGIGAQWDRLTLFQAPGDEYNLAFSILMLWVDGILYLLLALYIEAVVPGNVGIPRPFYFIFSKSYWFPEKRPRSNVYEQIIGSSNPSLEAEPTGLKKGVVVQNLSKTYSNGRVALSNLNVTFYEGQITSFLGHNGAGKTTTISILTGLYPPTSGTAKVYGHDICHEMNEVRQSLGICPQYNVLFERLNVEEHMLFYAGLKGNAVDQMQEIAKILVDLGIPHKRREYPKNLSGGMKRKLCVAIAFIGGSRTVFLDEPTSGVDPYSRQAIWDLLLKYKAGRTIILTTHFMDEADILGDRIAIISKGKLKACGSSLFLKAQFGLGYSLRMVKSWEVSGPAEEREDEDTILARIQKHTEGVQGFVQERIPDAFLSDDIGSEVVLTLPYSTTESFPSLFRDLDFNLKTLQITSYGLADTSLEDVFLKITLDDIEEDKSYDNLDEKYRGRVGLLLRKLRKTKPRRAKTSEEEWDGYGSIDGSKGMGSEVDSIQSSRKNGEDDEIKFAKAEGFGLLVMQFLAINFKRYKNALRNKKSIFFEILLPPLFVLIMLILTSIVPKVGDPTSRELTPWAYENPEQYFFISEPQYNGSRIALEDSFREITGPIGIGTPCLKDKVEEEGICEPNKWSNATVEEFNSTRLLYNGTTIANCTCKSGYQICGAAYEDEPPPSLKLETNKDIILDVSNLTIPDWLVKTYQKYEGKMYGGFEMDWREPYAGNISELGIMLQFLFQSRPYDLKELRPRNKNITTYKIWFENRGWISNVAYLNALHNVLLRQYLPPHLRYQKNEFGLTLFNHPLNHTTVQQMTGSFNSNQLGLMQAICIIFALSTVPASFAVYLIEERVRGGKHLHLVSGLRPLTYWISNFCFDLVKYQVPLILIIILFLAFNAQSYIGAQSIRGFILLLFLFGMASIPMMYCATHFFQVASTAFVVLACGNLFIGIITTVSAFILGQLKTDKELLDISAILQDVYLIFPQYCLGWGLITLFKLDMEEKVAKYVIAFQNVQPPGRLEWGNLGKLICALCIHLLFFFVLNLLLEYRRALVNHLFKKKHGAFNQIPQDLIVTSQANIRDMYEDEDEDVQRERVKVNSSPLEDATVVAENLTKVYRRNMNPSVNKICFAMERGECFGLLGINGAGKSSTFKMLTGSITISRGTARIMGHDVQRDLDAARQHFGYCPQDDGIDPLLNTYEQLNLYGHLRGMRKEELKITKRKLVRSFGLTRDAVKLCGTYSGGNKRKVSTAVALIGDPEVVFLDEPTTGMDPGARRKFWKVILKLLRTGKSIVLTSHSMEECEALCTKLAIMVNGKFQCLGSLQHLKNRFGNGYTVIVRFEVERKNEFLELMNKEFPTAVLEDVHVSQMKWRIPQEDVNLGRVFEILAKAKEDGLVDDSSVSQTTLDDIFVKFAGGQKEDKERT